MNFPPWAHLYPILVTALLPWLVPSAASGQEAVCATVKLEVQQEVTLARQAFEARLKINNTLPVSLTNLNIQMLATGADGTPVSLTTDPSNTNALFFYRTEGTHPTTVPASSSPTLEWTLIPAALAGGAEPSGKIYRVSAVITYTASGKNETVTVTPDTIRVLPLPLIEFDYFLAGDVQGDDPLTPALEPVIPFTLGLRVKNAGAGTAKALKVKSAQPVIVDNAVGARIQFAIRDTRLDDLGTTPALDVIVGDLLPGNASMIRWSMACNLAGRMTQLSAEATHSDELGGALTALLQAPASHLLVGNVLVDLPGRDGVSDFLAWSEVAGGLGAGNLTVYESGEGAGATLLPPSAIFMNGSPVPVGPSRWRVLTPAVPAQSFLYARVTDPTNGGMVPVAAIRSDGKRLPAQNLWASSRVETAGGQRVTRRYVHLFDSNPSITSSDFSYILEFGAEAGGNRPPVLGPLADVFSVTGSPVSFQVSAVDPDGSPPALLLATRPQGAVFNDSLNGTGVFSWTPARAGTFPLSFKAADGHGGQAERTITVFVSATSRLDAWKQRWWPGVNDSAITGNTADPDHDNLTNLYEYATGLDPTRVSTEQRPVLSRATANGKTYLVYTVVHRTDDLSLTVETLAASDPAALPVSGIPVPTLPLGSQSEVPPGFRRAVFRDSTALEDSATGRYLRLQVHLTEVP